MECGGLCKNSASFPVMCHLIDFTDKACTVHNFIRSTKLISSCFKEEIELIISKKNNEISLQIGNLSSQLLKW